MPRIIETCNTVALLQLLLMDYLKFQKRTKTFRTEFKVIIILSSQKAQIFFLLKVVVLFLLFSMLYQVFNYI